MTGADHLQNLAAEVATLDRKLKVAAQGLADTEEARNQAEARVAALEKVLSSIISEGARCRGDQAYRNFCRYAINASQQALHRGRTGTRA